MVAFPSLRPIRALTTVSLAALLVASCAPQQAPAPSGGSSGGTTSGSTPQIFRYPLSSIKTIDPGLATDTVSNDVVTKLFDSLLELKADGSIAPMIAEKWELNADATQFTFTIGANRKWSDGKDITAQDAEYALKRVLNPKTASEYANTIDIIKNGKNIIAGKADPSTAGVRATGPKTLVIETESPAAYFLALMTTWTASPVRQDVVDKGGNKWTEANNIVTSGPFKLKEWVADQKMTLTRNDEYYGTKAKLSQVDIRIFSDSNDLEGQILRAYEADELDSTGTYGVPPSEVDRILRDSKLSKEVQIFPQSRTEWVCLNHAKAPFSDVRVRTALGISLERQKAIDQVLKTVAQPMFGLIPEGIAGRNAEAWPKEDLAKAKQLLAEAGYPNGQGFPEITYQYNASASNKTFAEYVGGRWTEALGIKVKYESMDFPVFLTFRRGNKTYDVFRCSWGSDYEDPYNWHNTLFTSDVDSQQQTTNWRNPQYDDLVGRAAKEPDVAKRAQMYKDAEALMAKDYFVVPVLSASRRVMVKPYVKDYNLKKVAGGAELVKVSLNK